ncbi:MAG: citrate synthase [Deltaproteobacteria bacterium]|nr:citrate synthase [Deltaproteobacteria bacterium]
MTTTTTNVVPGLSGVPVAESKICFIDGERGVLEYRGFPIEVLAEKSTYEETSFLLLKGRLPTRPELEAHVTDLTHHRRLKYRIVDLIKCLPDSGHPMGALQAAVAAMGMFYPVHDVHDAKTNALHAIRLVAKLPTIVAAYHRLRNGDEAIVPRDDLSHAANFVYMLTEKEPEPHVARVMDVALLLHAEHSFNASTFASRVTGSTLADPYSVITSAIGALRGPLHGGANEEVVGFLRELGSVDNVRPRLAAMIRTKQRIMGFGHRIYKVKDPRANILQALARRLCETHRSRLYDIAVETETVVREQLSAKGIYPNVDFYSGIVYEMMGIPTDLFTPLFAIARVSGWLAHWFEQLEANRIFRPDQEYKGSHNLSYTPIERRA